MTKQILTECNERMGQWLAEKTGCQPLVNATYVGLEEDGELIAVCGYDDYLKSSVRSHIAITGQPTREFLKLIFTYPFDQLKVKKMIAPIHSGNVKVHDFCNRLGFRLEAVVKDTFSDGDLFFLTLVRNECRMLSVRLP